MARKTISNTAIDVSDIGDVAVPVQYCTWGGYRILTRKKSEKIRSSMKNPQVGIGVVSCLCVGVDGWGTVHSMFWRACSVVLSSMKSFPKTKRVE